MAKTRTRRFRRKTGRWSANIQEINHTTITASAGPTSWSGTTTLATNPAQNVLGVSQVYTVKNVETNFTIEGTTTGSVSIEAVTAYIMYVPQGMNVTETYHLEHPEYIMTYKYLGSPTQEYQPGSGTPSTQQYQPFKVKTRMARRLQTGDSIILFIKGYNETTTEVNMKLSGVIRWWTKAN